MDALSDVLSAVRLVGSLYFTTEFKPPWGVRVPAYGRVARFHVVLKGSCWVSTDDGEPPTLLESKDLIFVPHGASHTLSDAPDTPCVDVDRVVETAGFRGDGPLIIDGVDERAPARLLCGHLEFDESIDHPLFTGLPSRIVVRQSERVDSSEIDDLIRVVAHEIQSELAGGAAVLRRISEVLFVQAVRRWVDERSESAGILAAMSDRSVGRGLTAMHERLEQSWTLAALAREAGMSRTAFARRFREMVGMTPMQYLALWRMQKARELLGQTALTVEAVAARVGYTSLPAFSRAFKQWVGEPPGQFRRRLSAAS